MRDQMRKENTIFFGDGNNKANTEEESFGSMSMPADNINYDESQETSGTIDSVNFKESGVIYSSKYEDFKKFQSKINLIKRLVTLNLICLFIVLR